MVFKDLGDKQDEKIAQSTKNFMFYDVKHLTSLQVSFEAMINFTIPDLYHEQLKNAVTIIPS